MYEMKKSVSANFSRHDRFGNDIPNACASYVTRFPGFEDLLQRFSRDVYDVLIGEEAIPMSPRIPLKRTLPSNGNSSASLVLDDEDPEPTSTAHEEYENMASEFAHENEMLREETAIQEKLRRAVEVLSRENALLKELVVTRQLRLKQKTADRT